MRQFTRRLAPLSVDPYLGFLLAAVILGFLLPAAGSSARGLATVVQMAVAVLFFTYGAKLSRAEVLGALRDYKPQLLVLATTFVFFPGLVLVLLGGVGTVLDAARGSEGRRWLGPELRNGLLFLSVLPSTVQSSIAFTSIARGNVAAAVCAASVSNVVGIIVTPLLTSLLIARGARADVGAGIQSIALQILLPFVLGQLARPWLGDWLARHRRMTGLFDRGSILLIVYAAFSAGTVAGVWQHMRPGSFLLVLGMCAVLLGLVLGLTVGLSAALGFGRADRIAIVFCGSKKSMASGIPMANVLFSAEVVSMVVLPLMVFHQLQLFVCAILAQRLNRAHKEGQPGTHHVS